MVEIISGLASTAKIIYEIAERSGNEDLRREISRLKTEIADVQSAYADSVMECNRLRFELDTIKDTVSGKLKFSGNAYYIEDSGIPYCVGCAAGKRMFVPLIKTRGDLVATTHKCPVCNQRYTLGI